MGDSQWTKKGGTFIHKNACKEFGISEDEIIQGMKDGKLQYRVNYAHGNPYYRVLREEVKAFAEELHGASGVETQELKYKIKTIDK